MQPLTSPYLYGVNRRSENFLIICRIFVPHTQDNAFSLLHVWGAKKRQIMLLNFLIIFII